MIMYSYIRTMFVLSQSPLQVISDFPTHYQTSFHYMNIGYEYHEFHSTMPILTSNVLSTHDSGQKTSITGILLKIQNTS